MRAQLVPIRGGDPISIVRDITLVGRQEQLCDVVLDRTSISKMHCLIVRTDGLLFIRDLGSTNGTRVNGQRVVRGALLPGDELAFAGERFRVEMGPGDPDVVTDTDERTEEIRVQDAPVEWFDQIGADLDRVEPAFQDPLMRTEQTPPPARSSESDVRLLEDD